MATEAPAGSSPVSSPQENAGSWEGIQELLGMVVERNASDLHLTVGTPPVLRIDGDLKRVEGWAPLEAERVREFIYAVITQKQRERLEENLELDLSYSLPNEGRFRVNVYFQRDSLGAAFRLIPVEIRDTEQLGLPMQVAKLAELPRGLVLVTGPTGHGKSTTLASLVDIVNRNREVHIMTVEDPIEFLHLHKKAIVNQREVGTDTKSFAEALRHVLRQDPDVILIGEMRDLETISIALTAAETGHLVFATLHTQDAPQSIDRIIDVFPPYQQDQVRVQLASTLQGILSQQLLPHISGQGRVVSTEVLMATPAVRNLIREAKVHQIYSAMQAGDRFGMQTMDQSLARLVKQGKISRTLALERCHHEDELKKLLGDSR